jgi:hypothetical protein
MSEGVKISALLVVQVLTTTGPACPTADSGAISLVEGEPARFLML